MVKLVIVGNHIMFSYVILKMWKKKIYRLRDKCSIVLGRGLIIKGNDVYGAIIWGYKQLGINLTKRKAMQEIYAIDGGIGAAVNGNFMRGIGYAARRSYQGRWLRDNDKWIE